MGNIGSGVVSSLCLRGELARTIIPRDAVIQGSGWLPDLLESETRSHVARMQHVREHQRQRGIPHSLISTRLRSGKGVRLHRLDEQDARPEPREIHPVQYLGLITLDIIKLREMDLLGGLFLTEPREGHPS
jgi:hypothetical protein